MENNLVTKRYYQVRVIWVFILLYLAKKTKKNFKDMENTVWENKTLPKACLLRVFEFLKYQNAETRLTNALW